jgi:hypothetical protein
MSPSLPIIARFPLPSNTSQRQFNKTNGHVLCHFLVKKVNGLSVVVPPHRGVGVDMGELAKGRNGDCGPGTAVIVQTLNGLLLFAVTNPK